jgi:hypothetical protein
LNPIDLVLAEIYAGLRVDALAACAGIFTIIVAFAFAGAAGLFVGAALGSTPERPPLHDASIPASAAAASTRFITDACVIESLR